MTYEYDAFGNERDPDPEDGNPFRYCGEYYDTETGAYYLRSRYYDPIIGRMLSEGSVRVQMRKISDEIEVPDSLSLNLYTYCTNNPILYQDSSGHIFMFVTAAIGAAVGVVIGGITAAVTGNNVWAGIGIGVAAGGLVGLTGAPQIHKEQDGLSVG